VFPRRHGYTAAGRRHLAQVSYLFERLLGRVGLEVLGSRFVGMEIYCAIGAVVEPFRNHLASPRSWQVQV
jgi:hypothetical protein